MEMNFKADEQRARRWRLRAEECRTLADNITNEASRSTLLGVADGYDRLAALSENPFSTPQ
jgi:hypothetical protein